MTKTKIGIIICVLILMGFVGYFAYEYFGSNTSKVDDVINITKNNNKFLKDKKVTFDNKKNIYLIDNQYEVQKKNGYFVMNVNNDSDGLVYCAFVADYESGNFDVDADGVYNTCLKTLDGTIVKSGDTFSLWNTLGCPNKEKGYKKAKAFTSDGDIKQSYGGGICQVSTTIYNALLKIDEIKITERHEHSRDVVYIKDGKDAAVSYKSADLKFKNNADYDIKLKASVKNNKVIIKIEKL